ncbi:MAG: futalosine hydrolase [Bacteroidales bacterium]|nr:futalosine hydrolase [Bacteroidales bacterium]MBN2763847.1 futalosine hydrolase [Bacteroidales bacterium]
MKILIVVASSTEIKEVRDNLTFVNKLTPNLSSFIYGNLNIDILVTGYGSVFTAFHLTRTLFSYNYDLAINAGVAGSFDYFLEQGFVVNVIQDQFADLGFEDKLGFYTLGEKEMINEDSFPFTGEIMRSLGNFEIEEIESMIPVKAITVNTIHGSQEKIQRLKSKYHAEIETMEGAAFFYVCLMEKVPFLQIRAVSNFVEIPKVENWYLPLALKNLTKSMMDIFGELRID